MSPSSASFSRMSGSQSMLTSSESLTAGGTVPVNNPLTPSVEPSGRNERNGGDRDHDESDDNTVLVPVLIGLIVCATVAIAVIVTITLLRIRKARQVHLHRLPSSVTEAAVPAQPLPSPTQTLKGYASTFLPRFSSLFFLPLLCSCHVQRRLGVLLCPTTT